MLDNGEVSYTRGKEMENVRKEMEKTGHFGLLLKEATTCIYWQSNRVPNAHEILLFVAKKMLNYAAQSLFVLIVLVKDHNDENNRAQ